MSDRVGKQSRRDGIHTRMPPGDRGRSPEVGKHTLVEHVYAAGPREPANAFDDDHRRVAAPLPGTQAGAAPPRAIPAGRSIESLFGHHRAAVQARPAASRPRDQYEPPPGHAAVTGSGAAAEHDVRAAPAQPPGRTAGHDVEGAVAPCTPETNTRRGKAHAYRYKNDREALAADDERHGGERAGRRPGKRTWTETIFRAGHGAITQDPEAVFLRATQGAAAAVPFRAEMERRYGADFSNVRAFLGRASEARQLGARGATRGEQIVFASSTPDRALVAHELTHVLQQRAAGGAATGRAVSDPGDAAEVEARRAAERVDAEPAHEAPGAAFAHASPSAAVHRDDEIDAGISLAQRHDFLAWAIPALARELASNAQGVAKWIIDRLSHTTLEDLCRDSAIATTLFSAGAPDHAALIAQVALAVYQTPSWNLIVLDSAKRSGRELGAKAVAMGTSAAVSAAFGPGMVLTAVGVIAGAATHKIYRDYFPALGHVADHAATIPLCRGFLDFRRPDTGDVPLPWYGFIKLPAMPVVGPLGAGWLRAGGSVQLDMVDHEQVVALDASHLVLELGEAATLLALIGITATWDPLVGLHITRASGTGPYGTTVQSPHVDVRISPAGRISGRVLLVREQIAERNNFQAFECDAIFHPAQMHGFYLDHLVMDVHRARFQCPAVAVEGRFVPTADQLLLVSKRAVSGVSVVITRDDQTIQIESCQFEARADQVILSGKGQQDGAPVSWKATAVGRKDWTIDVENGAASPSEAGSSEDGASGEISTGAAEDAPSPARGGDSLVDKVHAALLQGAQSWAYKAFTWSVHQGVKGLVSKAPKPKPKGASAQTPATVQLAGALQQGGESYVPPAKDDAIPAAKPSANSWWPATFDPFARVKLPDFGGGGLLPTISITDATGGIRDAAGKLAVHGSASLHVTIPQQLLGRSDGDVHGSSRIGMVWFPYDSPYIVLSGGLDVGDWLQLRGIEADPIDGLSVASARLSLPLPDELGGERSRAEGNASWLLIGRNGVSFREFAARIVNLKVPPDAGPDDVSLHFNRLGVAAQRGGTGTRFKVEGDGELYNVLEGHTFWAGASLAWGGGAGLAIDAAVRDRGEIRLLDDKLKLVDPTGAFGLYFHGGKLRARGRIGAGRVELRPTEHTLITGAGALELGSDGKLDGTDLHGLSVTYRQFSAGIDRLWIQNDEVHVQGLAFGLDMRDVISLADEVGIGDALAAIEQWLPVNDVKLRIGFDLVVAKDKKPNFSRPRFGVRRANFHLFGAKAGFDLDQGLAWLGFRKKETFAPSAQVPLYYGVGLDVGGIFCVQLEADAKFCIPTGSQSVKDVETPPFTFGGGVSVGGALSGSVSIGAFGGIPHVASVSGGLHAGLRARAEADLMVSGEITPKGFHIPDGSIGASFKIHDSLYKDHPATFHGIAGPFIKVSFSGINSTVKLNLIRVPLAELEAYGAISTRIGKLGEDDEGRVRKLPEGNFPATRLSVHDRLKRALNFSQNQVLRLRRHRAQSRLDRDFTRLAAVNARIDEERRTEHRSPEERMESYHEQLAEPMEHVREGKAEHKQLNGTLKQTEKDVELWEERLAGTEIKLRQFKWQLHYTDERTADEQPDFDDDALDDAAEESEAGELELELDDGGDGGDGGDDGDGGDGSEKEAPAKGEAKRPGALAKLGRAYRAIGDAKHQLGKGHLGSARAVLRSKPFGFAPAPEDSTAATRFADKDHLRRGEPGDLSATELALKVKQADEDAEYCRDRVDELKQEMERLTQKHKASERGYREAKRAVRRVTIKMALAAVPTESERAMARLEEEMLAEAERLAAEEARQCEAEATLERERAANREENQGGKGHRRRRSLSERIVEGLDKVKQESAEAIASLKEQTKEGVSTVKEAARSAKCNLRYSSGSVPAKLRSALHDGVDVGLEVGKESGKVVGSAAHGGFHVVRSVVEEGTDLVSAAGSRAIEGVERVADRGLETIARACRSGGKVIETAVQGALKLVKKTLAGLEIVPDSTIEGVQRRWQGQLVDSWARANHAYRIIERRQHRAAHELEKLEAEDKTIEARLRALRGAARDERALAAEHRVPPLPLPLTPSLGPTLPSLAPTPSRLAMISTPSSTTSPAATTVAQALPHTGVPFNPVPEVPDGPVFDVTFEIQFWTRRRDDIQIEKRRAQEWRERKIEMDDPTRGLDAEKMKLLDGAMKGRPDRIEKAERRHEKELHRREKAIAKAEARCKRVDQRIEWLDGLIAGGRFRDSEHERELRGRLEVAKRQRDERDLAVEREVALHDLTAENLTRTATLGHDDDADPELEVGAAIGLAAHREDAGGGGGDGREKHS